VARRKEWQKEQARSAAPPGTLLLLPAVCHHAGSLFLPSFHAFAASLFRYRLIERWR